MKEKRGDKYRSIHKIMTGLTELDLRENRRGVLVLLSSEFCGSRKMRLGKVIRVH